jgi:sugar-specific transcriptional regulator TrmB
MPTDIFSLFTSLGLSESESKVYFSSLSLGPASVQDIAKKARLSRTATYAAVEALQNRGLMSTHERGKKSVFAAEEPERAVSHFKEKVHDMQEKVETLNKMLPEIKLMSGGERPAVRFYEGKEALYALFTDVGRLQPETLCEIANLDDVYAHLDLATLGDVRKMLDPKKTKIRILHIGNTKDPRAEIFYSKVNKEVFGDFHGDIWIYNDRVAFIYFIGKVVTVILENQAFADTARFLFEVAWKSNYKEK